MTQSKPQNPMKTMISNLEVGLPRIDDYLEKWASQSPTAIAAICGNDEITYKDLDKKSGFVALALTEMGIKDGDVVAVLVPPSIDFLVLFLAISKLGAIWLGLNPKYTTAELEFTISDAKPKLVLARRKIGQTNFEESLAGLIGELPSKGYAFAWIDKLFKDKLDASFRVGKPKNNVAALVYTSGSTGRPKPAQLSHKALIRGALVRSKVWSVTPFVTINNVPINHVGALGDICCTCLVAGGCQVFLESFSALGTLEALDKHKVTYWYQAPTMFEMCMSEEKAGQIDWSHLKAAIWSGGRAPLSLIKKLLAVADNLAVDYSMTESVGALSLTPLTRNIELLSDSVGFMDCSRNVRIMDLDTGTIIEGYGSGEVQIKDQFMFDGYRKNTSNLGSFTQDGWFKTGDVVSINKDGSWKITGRCKEMFKSGGYNIYPKEIEIAIETHEAVKEAAVVEVPDKKFGEIGIAFVVLSETIKSADAIGFYCRSILANYKVPKQFIILEAMPMLPIGKINKARLREMAKSIVIE